MARIIYDVNAAIIKQGEAASPYSLSRSAVESLNATNKLNAAISSISENMTLMLPTAAQNFIDFDPNKDGVDLLTYNSTFNFSNTVVQPMPTLGWGLATGKSNAVNIVSSVADSTMRTVNGWNFDGSDPTLNNAALRTSSAGMSLQYVGNISDTAPYNARLLSDVIPVTANTQLYFGININKNSYIGATTKTVVTTGIIYYDTDRVQVGSHIIDVTDTNGRVSAKPAVVPLDAIFASVFIEMLCYANALSAEYTFSNTYVGAAPLSFYPNVSGNFKASIAPIKNTYSIQGYLTKPTVLDSLSSPTRLVSIQKNDTPKYNRIALTVQALTNISITYRLSIEISDTKTYTTDLVIPLTTWSDEYNYALFCIRTDLSTKTIDFAILPRIDASTFNIYSTTLVASLATEISDSFYELVLGSNSNFNTVFAQICTNSDWLCNDNLAPIVSADIGYSVFSLNDLRQYSTSNLVSNCTGASGLYNWGLDIGTLSVQNDPVSNEYGFSIMTNMDISSNITFSYSNNINVIGKQLIGMALTCARDMYTRPSAIKAYITFYASDGTILDTINSFSIIPYTLPTTGYGFVAVPNFATSAQILFVADNLTSSTETHYLHLSNIKVINYLRELGLNNFISVEQSEPQYAVYAP